MRRIVLICVLALGLAAPALPVEAKPAAERKSASSKAKRSKTAKQRRLERKRRRARAQKRRRARARKRRRARVRASKRRRHRRSKRRRRRRRRHHRLRLPRLPSAWAYPPTAAMRHRGYECLRSLTQLGVKWRRGNRIGRVATPVEIRDANLNGVKIVSLFKRRTVMDCHLARAIAMNAPAISELGIAEIHYSSIHRHSRMPRSRRLSRHNLGLAVDIWQFRTKTGKTLVVGKHYWRSRTLRKFIRAMRKTKMFRSILYPGNDRHHRDHFHLEAKMHVTRRW